MEIKFRDRHFSRNIFVTSKYPFSNIFGSSSYASSKQKIICYKGTSPKDNFIIFVGVSELAICSRMSYKDSQ